jgi:hypothetical protein
MFQVTHRAMRVINNENVQMPKGACSRANGAFGLICFPEVRLDKYDPSAMMTQFICECEWAVDIGAPGLFGIIRGIGMNAKIGAKCGEALCDREANADPPAYASNKSRPTL